MPTPRPGGSTLFNVVAMLAALLWLMPLPYRVPQAVLAGVVVTAIIGLLKPRVVVALRRISRVEGGLALATISLTLAGAPDIYWGVLGALLASLAYYMFQNLHRRTIDVGLHAHGSLRNRHLWALPPLAPNAYALRIDAGLDCATANAPERTVTQALSQPPSLTDVCLFAQPINRIEITGTEPFAAIRRLLESRGARLHLSALKFPAQQVLERAGLLYPSPLMDRWRSEAETLAALRQPKGLPTAPDAPCP